MIDPDLIRAWKPRLHALDPWRVMSRVELEDLYAERPDAPSERVAHALMLAADPSAVKMMVCGARGSGKSTELTRVGSFVKDQFAVVQLDIIAALREGQSTLAIIAMLGVGGLRAVHDWSHPAADLEWPPQGALLTLAEGLGKELQRFGVAAEALGTWVIAASPALVLHRPEAAAAAAAAGTGAVAVARAVRKGGDLLQKLPELGRGQLGRGLAPADTDAALDLVASVQAIYDRLAEVAGRPPLLLVDGLDQLATIDEIRAAVADAHLLAELRLPLVFSGPIQLRHHEHFSGLPGRFRPEVVHNLSVVTHDPGGAIVPGPDVAVLRSAYQKRANAGGLGADFIGDAAVRLLARSSSGIVREFFLLLQKAGMAALNARRHVITDADVATALREQRHFLQLALNEERTNLLGRVLQREQMAGDDEAEALLFGNYIACYQNENLWFRPHEILVDYVRQHLPPDDRAEADAR